MRKIFSMQAPLAAAAVLFSSGLANAEQIGSTVKVVNAVTASLDANLRNLALGDAVSQDELIVTGTDAISEFKFKDDTKVALGPGAQLKLDRFVYDPAKTDGTIAVELVKGAFRFMTGVAQKPSYKIDTPNATIAVRGTIFDLYVQQDGTTWLLLHEGGVRVCSRRSPERCQDNDKPGHMMRVTSVGDVGTPICWSGLPGSQSVPFETAFPFVVSPPSIDDKPIYIRDDIVRSDCAAPQRSTPPTPPVRRTNYQPYEPKQYQRPVKQLPKARPVKEVNIPYYPPVKIKPTKSRVEIPEETYQDYKPNIKIKPKKPRYEPVEVYDDPPKRKRPTKETKVYIPDVDINIYKKPKRQKPRGDDYGDYEKPRRKPKQANNYDGEVAKKLLGIGLGLAIGGFGNKHHSGGDYSGRRGSDY
jgi:hypothetical protein